ncbi:MAG: DUF115 domain-containing protein [Treponema sp.]|jgi:hypothetical protein|nr:DUF115 domain-containing protein [Treponema sp.]
MKRYTLKTARNNSVVPAIVDDNGADHALHSLFDPQKEAERLLGVRKDEGFLVFLGLGGGFSVAQALACDKGVRLVLIVDYGREGLEELFSVIDYSSILSDPRVFLLIDPAAVEIEAFILERYQPALMNGMRVFPLRARIDVESAPFRAAEAAINGALKKVSADYSVQAHFGLRWFSNIIQNIQNIKNMGLARKDAGQARWRDCFSERSVKCASITAAGPSLDRSLPLLREQRTRRFIIATDTSLPALLAAGVEPDAVVSIDCQLWSYNHFFRRTRAPLFLDLASPPALAERSSAPYFFSGGHPLSRLFSRAGTNMPELDVSGGNVTYAAVSLAEALGAETVELFGADFSYPSGAAYARGTWLHPFYGKRQNRFSPAETFFSHLIYRTPLEKRYADGSWRYETPTLAMYRAKLEERQWAPQKTPRGAAHSSAALDAAHSAEFLAAYREKLRSLSFRRLFDDQRLVDDQRLDPKDAVVIATLLPAAAALRHREPELAGERLLEATREWCMKRL